MDADRIVADYRARVLATRDRWGEVCAIGGVTRVWLNKFASGETSNPTLRTLAALDRGLRAVENPEAAA